MTIKAKYYIDVETVGQAFGCQAVIRSTRSRVIHRTDPPRPHGYGQAAYDDGRAWATAHGYHLMAADDQ